MAELAIHSITRMLEPDRGRLWYNGAPFSRRRPVITLGGAGT